MRQARKNLYASKAIPGKKIKAEIGLARGKKKFEKKEKIKKRDTEREMRREMKG